MVRRAASGIGARIERAEDDLGQPSRARIEKGPGGLEHDPASGVYRPAKRD
jgi:hypothetical protein